ncbi:hypothetical protein NUW54_g3109 [Trametes sanguinea]|uniref:Uncharacterized protein n=1 Tax=Trametes sanguinea TaxID=158606 RepID=A0ACC1Q3C5_9APHY|nr:hypothetical protein NUW54_g3109 [Trametes sanguinea]
MGRVGRESEEVAFYGGGLRERSILWRAYLRLIRHVNSIYKIRIAYEWTEDFVIKYLWSAAGYCLISIPVFFTRRRRHVGVQAHGPRPNEAVDNEVANRTETYISSRRLLLYLADAGGRLMYAYKDLLELAGLTTRLYTLLSTLHNLPPLPMPTPDPKSVVALRNVDVGVPSIAPAFLAAAEGESHANGNGHANGSAKGSGTVLVRGLSFELEPGEHLMITGSNGVGKTAIARQEPVLAGHESVTIPRGGEMRGVRESGERLVLESCPLPLPFVAPLFERMTTQIVVECLTTSEAALLFDAILTQLPDAVSDTPVTVTPSTDCLRKPDLYWSQTTPRLRAAWVSYRTPVIPWHMQLFKSVADIPVGWRVVKFMCRSLQIWPRDYSCTLLRLSINAQWFLALVIMTITIQ